MANKEQLERLKAGVEEWNAWRKGAGVGIDLREADLREADLRGADLWSSNFFGLPHGHADLSGANLSGANLNGAVLNGADLSRANLRDSNLGGAGLLEANLNSTYLSNTDLRGANLSSADLNNAELVYAELSGATLIDANLIGADLRGANLGGMNLGGPSLKFVGWGGATLIDANLISADLRGANLKGANLKGANLSHARLANTSLGILDLSGAVGLVEAEHRQPSTIGTDTLELTARGLQDAPPERRGEVEIFLHRAGVSKLVMDTFQLMVASPIEFYSVFISYSHRDKPFARRLYEALQARGIRCWLDEHALLPGDDIADSIDHGIRIWDKVLLCCSEDSLRSYWVEAEVDKAVEKEQQLRKDRGKKIHAIIPLDLDGYLETWQDGRASMIRKRLAADFKGWDTDHAKFEAQLEQVCAALQTEREPGPEPKL